MNAHSRSRNSSTSESESTTDVSCADSMPAPINAVPVHHQQRFILTPNMYFQDAVYRTFSYAPPPPPSVIKNFAPILPPEMQRATISTCIKPQADCSSYRYRYYAPAGPVAASRLVKGEAAPKRFAPIEQSMSFQNFGARLQYPANQSFDSSYRNISFEPMNYESSRHLEQFNRPVSNLWQMAGSSANATNSSQKFLNQYAMNEALGPNGATGYHNSNNNNYFQDKNLLSHKSAKLRNSFKLKALAIIGLVLVVVISIAVILSVVITRSAMASSTSLPMQDGNQKRLLNSSRFHEDNSTDSDTIVVGVDISLNVTSGKTFFFDNSTQSNSSLVAAAARLLFSQFNSTSTSSNIGSQIIQKFKHLDTSNATIYDPELLDMLSNYSNHSNYSNATMNDTRVTLN